MSCVISSAICCLLVTGSVSGVALGYNYSLAEFIGSKETNVSVYVKRGIFDDDSGEDDADWRRSGHKSLKGLVRDEGNVITMEPENNGSTLRSGRRLDDSIVESDRSHNFEGSLMRMTVKPIVPTTTSPVDEVTTREIQDIVSQFTMESLDQLKAIQALISMRKAEAARETTEQGMTPVYPLDQKIIPDFPAVPSAEIRRRMNGPPRTPYPNYAADNPARYAVPDSSINEEVNWMRPKRPDMFRKSNYDYNDPMEPITYPSPILYNTGPARPTRPIESIPSRITTVKQEPVTRSAKVVEVTEKPADLSLDDLKEKLILDKYESQRFQPDDKTHKGPKKSIMDYYDDDIKGLPVRRKRSINRIKRKATRAGHEKEIPEEGEENRHNEITNYQGVLMTKLVFSNTVTPQSFNKKIEIEERLNGDNSAIVNILKSMFS